MGQKVNPHGMRVGVIKDWDSRWYAKDEKVGDLIVEDYNIRKFLKKTLYGAGVPKIEIERSNDVVTLFVHCARPGMVIGKDVGTAMAILMQTPKAASEPLIKLLKSAVANAENNFSMDTGKLYVSEVYATGGPILKRMIPASKGRGYRINKRTSHVTLAVAEKE